MGEFDASASEHGLAIEAVDWLPSGGRSGLVRVRGKRPAGDDLALPELVVERGGEVHRHSSLPDPRAGRVPGAWRGAYVVHADLIDSPDARLRLEFGGGLQIALPRPGTQPPAAERPEPAGGEVVDRAVLADRRARRAEAAEQAQARIAREALKAVEVLELRAAQLEERLEAVSTERDALAARAGQGHAAPSPEVPELRRRLAEAEARVRELRERRPASGSVEEADRRAERLREALTTAIGNVGELRLELHEARVRSRTAEIVNAAEAVRLRVLASERGALIAEMESLRSDVAEAEQLRTIQAAEIQRMSARAAGAEAAHEETRRAFAQRVGELREARERIAGLESELAALHAELPERVRVAVQERSHELEARHEQAERELAAREGEAQAALDAARRELERVEAALSRAETEREVAQATAAAAEMRLRAGDVARAAGAPVPSGLVADLEAARAQIAQQESDLTSARALIAAQAAALDAIDDGAVVDGLTADLSELRERASTLEAELAAERARRLEAEQAAQAERDRRLEAEQAAQAERERRLEAEAASRRAVEPAPPVPPELPARAAEQEQAAAAAEPPPAPGRLVADLAAAAAALRARRPEPEPAPEPEPTPEPAPFLAPQPPTVPAPDAAPAAAEAEPAPAAEAAPRRPRITSPDDPPPGRVATGRLQRDLPSLRGALVKLAHDDAPAAARLLVGLLPAQWRALDEPVDYDITIAEVGTYAVTVRAGGVHVRPLAGTRPDAEFHLRVDALTLAEMLAGHGPKPRRFGSPAKLSGKARRARVLQPLAQARMSLPDAVRAGARLEPELVLRTLAYAVRPSWTAGHSFTIAHTFTGADGDETLYITARDGRGLTISHDAPGTPPDATVILTRAAFEALLRGEAPPPGERPATRGDHRAAHTLRAWADRARSGGV